MRILATSAYSGWNVSAEAVQKLLGISVFRAKQNVFDTLPPKEIQRLQDVVREGNFPAIVIDNHYVPQGVGLISHVALDFAKQMREELGAETFFLDNAKPVTEADINLQYARRLSFACKLSRACKPFRLGTDQKPTFRIALTGGFDEELFDVETCAVKRRSFGDSGWEQVQHWVREGFAFWERDWPKIAEAIEKEILS